MSFFRLGTKVALTDSQGSSTRYSRCRQATLAAGCAKDGAACGRGYSAGAGRPQWVESVHSVQMEKPQDQARRFLAVCCVKATQGSLIGNFVQFEVVIERLAKSLLLEVSQVPQARKLFISGAFNLQRRIVFHLQATIIKTTET